MCHSAIVCYNHLHYALVAGINYLVLRMVDQI